MSHNQAEHTSIRYVKTGTKSEIFQKYTTVHTLTTHVCFVPLSSTVNQARLLRDRGWVHRI